MESGDDRPALIGRRRGMPDRWRWRLRALPYLAAGGLVYLYAIFDTHQGSSLFRWIVGVYFPAFWFLVLVAVCWRYRDKNDRRKRL